MNRHISHAYQVIGRAGEGEHPIHFLQAAMPHLPQQCDRLQPAKTFFDPFPFALTDASVTFVTETASGWQQVNFATPVPISANTTYIVSYFAPNGEYAFDSNYFASGGVTNGPLHALANSEDPGGNGVYHYGSTSSFPSQTFNAANYWVDVVSSQ